MGARRGALAMGTVLALLGAAGPARADEPEPAALTATVPAPAPAPAMVPTVDPYATFPLAIPHDKHYVRAALEIGGVLAIGLVDYMLSTTARGGTTRAGDTRWGLRYDWNVLRGKLIGTGLNLDTNKNPTNYVSHPLAGTLYYSAARSNHLSLAESFGFAIVASTTWEFFGEIREITSVNDLVVTPVSGVAIGEPLMQLSGFLRRGKRHPTKDALSFVLAPMKFLNELTDGAEPLRGSLPWHRFLLSAGLGATVQDAEGAHPRASYFDQRFNADFRLVTLPSYEGAGKHAHLFDDGNVTRVKVDVAMSEGHLVDGLFATTLVPAGYWVRDAEIDASGRLRGHGAFVGLRMGFEYGGHDYDRDRARSSDVISIASPVGVAAEYRWTRGDFEVRTAFELAGAISSVTPYALASYRRAHTLDDVLTPVRQEGYYHAVAITTAPTLELGLRGLRSTTSLRIDTFHSIEGIDEQQSAVVDGPRFSDRRSLLRTTLAFVPPGTPLRLALDAQRATRSGTIGDVTDDRAESSVWASVGLEL